MIWIMYRNRTLGNSNTNIRFIARHSAILCIGATLLVFNIQTGNATQIETNLHKLMNDF